MTFVSRSPRWTILSLLAISLSLASIIFAQEPKHEEPQPPKIVRKSGGVLQGSATKRVEPPYPPLARAAQVTGSVVVEVTVDEKGSVIAARVISGHPLLKDAALAAARGWIFNPATLQGVPVKVIGTITFNFGADRSKDMEYVVKEIASNPSAAELRYQLGVLHLERAEPDKAIEPFKQAISLDPRFAKAYVGLGDAYWRSDHTELAVGAYKEAARIKPDYVDAYFYLGMLYWREKRHEEATEAFKQAVALDPQRTMAYVGMGRSYRSMGKYNEALEALKQAAKLKSDSLDAHLELGETYLEMGDRDSAMNEYEILKKIAPFMAEQLLQRIRNNN